MKNLKTKYLYFIIIALTLFYAFTSFGQCTNSPWGQYPGILITQPTYYTCDGTYVGVNDAWAGEYMSISVTEYNIYQFDAYRFSDYFITITDNLGNPITWGTPTITTPITWTATFTGTIRFYSHTNSSCGTSTSNSVKIFRCIGSVFPIELKSFTGINTNKGNELNWVTSTERNNDYFTIERSTDGINWTIINTTPGSGTTTMEQSYTYTDNNFDRTINYYRLTQTDYDGQSETFEPILIDNTNSRYIIKLINTAGQQVNEDATGILFEVYSDGSVKKIFK